MDPQQRLMLECAAEATLAGQPSATMLSGFKVKQVRLAFVLVIAPLLPLMLASTAGSLERGVCLANETLQ